MAPPWAQPKNAVYRTQSDRGPHPSARVRRHCESGLVSAAPRLFNFYASAISFALAADAQDPEARIEATGAETQQRMRRLLERANAAARTQGKPSADIDSAAFALAAWFDEIAARRTDWADAVAPLQLLWFNSTNAATEFFHHLSGLQPEQAELREIYWYLLALGFKGQYYFESGAGGAGELAKLRQLHAAQLPQPPVDLQQPTARLSPQPYSQADLPPAPGRRAPRRGLLLAAALALLLLPLAAWLVQGRTGPSVPAVALAEQITRHLQRHSCAALRAEPGADGILRVHGFVPRPEDIELVKQEVTRLAGTTATQVQLQWRPWPYCEVVDILQPHQLRNRQARQGLMLSAVGAPEGILREGDSVSLQVQAPAYEGVMWVDFYTADGAVLHLHAQGQRRVPFSPGQRLAFGDDLPSSWLVSPPFGPVLVTVIALPTLQPPAVAEPAPYELASDYLLRLRATLAAAGTATPPVADVLFLQTRER